MADSMEQGWRETRVRRYAWQISITLLTLLQLAFRVLGDGIGSTGV
jgi:hypothetical protein